MSRSSPSEPWIWQPAHDTVLRRMWRADATVVEIAVAIGCTQNQVDRRRKGIGLPPRPIGWKPASARKETPYYKPTPPTCRNADAAFARAIAGRTFGSLAMKASGAPARVLPVHRAEHRGASSLEIVA